jgi:hypothetical protein
MNDVTFWQCLSVQDFFGNSNWEGRQLAAEGEFFEDEIEPTSWLCLSLEEFLNQSNWEGKLLGKQTFYQQAPKELSLTLSVGEFFQIGAWDGKPGMATLPSRKSTPASNPIPSRNQQMKLNNLSDLF